MGAQDRSWAQIAGFRDMVDVCELYDLGFQGRSWTFEKKIVGGGFCRVRLDRALAMADWCNCFPSAYVSHLTAAASDHEPILLRWANQDGRRPGKKKKQLFRFEVMWESHEDFVMMLTQVWSSQGHAGTVQELHDKLTSVASQLQ